MRIHRVGASTREVGVYIDFLVLTARLHRALTVGIIPIVSHKTVFISGKKTVLLVPTTLLFTNLFVFNAVFLHTRGIDIDKVTIGIVHILMPIVDVRAVRRSIR